MQNIITVDEIFKRNEISVRTYHVCKYNQLHSILDILKYYYKNKSFEKLRNCGSKSNLELVNTCNKYQGDYYIENVEIEVKVENPLKNIVLNLTRIQREVINNFIFVKTNSLSVRSRNAIVMHLNNNLKVKNYTEKILLSENFKVQKIKNVGAKCIPELEVYISIIQDFILEVSQTTDEKYLIALKNKYLIQQTFNIPFVPSEILESESIFLLTDFLFNQNAFFDETQTNVVKKGLKLYNCQKEITLDEIAEQVDLSRERVRQIRKVCLEELFSKLLFISNFNDDLFQNYNIDTQSSYIEINTDILEKINNFNNTDFSREFITYILSVYLHKSFTLIGNSEDILQFNYFNSRNKHNWNNFYLIDKKLASEIDFTFFIDDVSSRLSDRIEESYSFNFKSYLSKFLTNNNVEILDLLFPICERVVNDEFEIYLDLDENLNFKKNSSKQVHQYAYEALEELGKPSTVKEIFDRVIELHPNYNTEEAKIRASMKRKNGFVPVGRISVFGLKKWENELENFKGGTIRDIVEEYLMLFSTPKHISNITEYVLKYRPKSSQYSILQNLKLDESGLYVFYKDSHIGLASKKYESDFKKLSEIIKTDVRTWAETFEIFQNFISIKQRLPFSSGVPEEEIKLYRWINLQQSKQKKGKVEENKKEKLNSLLTKYGFKNSKRRLTPQEKYEELISFVSINNRLPSANKDGEENLYKFYYKQRKLFEANELDNLEKIKFIEVAKLFQNMKI
ncbi:sigma factor-like helix-turn-helix DNA-binding protein [Flavobacterium sp. Fl-77]|uniref:Sigma factor-like helix-turn-helix DNA-binding protein n=1 Tax=Flavobacterium flavipigmentatum TaxID=2893884 RepID=A0AAJ2S9C8_9FLAO|nr:MULTISPECIES: sigma factor-like helix-turn-helix DNA-binding protein [unclassified Flavobacterium]MDX6180641.1 sigma factor-like helix-turn-helix DNA-binding protein [Flavobacterium sp. Fl-33]MDX6184241.1 sigma factor-like helix-turn-helix DNA-binding protein [Flavobacterium sp. Fl-77]UFH39353.1 hypothetical protein LNP22_03545 [Flavobacterium sp. F-70]